VILYQDSDWGLPGDGAVLGWPTLAAWNSSLTCPEPAREGDSVLLGYPSFDRSINGVPERWISHLGLGRHQQQRADALEGFQVVE
jgi:hypothetical protein